MIYETFGSFTYVIFDLSIAIYDAIFIVTSIDIKLQSTSWQSALYIEQIVEILYPANIYIFFYEHTQAQIAEK